MSLCPHDGLYCPLLEKDSIPDLPCEQCKRFCNAKAATLPRLGAVARSLILEAMNPPDKTPLRTLSEQASRRRAMDQLSKAGLLLAWYKRGGSWETKDGKKYYRHCSYRLKRVPKLTPLGEAIAELIADDINQGRRIRWSKVLQKLPPIGKNMIQVKRAWIEVLRQKLNNRQELLSLVRLRNPTAPGIPEINEEISQINRHILQVAVLTFLEHHPGQLTVWDDDIALFRYTHISA